jgi:hypothetical protein
MTDNSKYLAAAKRAGDWLVATQQQGSDNANLGRFYYAVNMEDGYSELSTGWQTAFAIIALLSLHKTTNENHYLDAATVGMGYINSLQVLDSRIPANYGAIREETPQTNWLHPRDALSAAWAMLIYGQYTHDHDAIERAQLFGDWLLNYGVIGDWPLCTVKLAPGGLDTSDLQGSFQSGGILFLIDLYRETQNIKYYDLALRMSDFYVDHFINETGEITVLLDKLGTHDLSIWPLDWQLMHQVNDDFGGIALAGSYEIFKKDIYQQRMTAYVKWLKSMANGDGSYLNPVMEVASATVPIFLNSYKIIASESEQQDLATMITSSLDYLLSLQQQSDNKNIDGAFLGMTNKCKNGCGKWVNIRCSAYAIIALLQYSNDALFPAAAVGFGTKNIGVD